MFSEANNRVSKRMRTIGVGRFTPTLILLVRKVSILLMIRIRILSWLDFDALISVELNFQRFKIGLVPNIFCPGLP